MHPGPATRKELREFGLVVGIAFAVLGTLLWWKHGKVDPRIFYSISAFLVLSGLLVPSILRPFQWAWMRLAVILGYVMNRVILGAIYFVVFTFVATIMRILKRDILHRAWQPEASTYWKMRPEERLPNERYERQF